MVSKIMEKARVCEQIESKVSEYYRNDELSCIKQTLRENKEMQVQFADLQLNHIKVEDFFELQKSDYSGILCKQGEHSAWFDGKRK
jgi:hypothetical protein